MSNSVNNKTAYGKSQPLIDVFNPPIVALRAPGNSDRAEIGQLWDFKTQNAVYMLTSFAAGIPVWTRLDNNAVTGITWNTDNTNAVAAAVNSGYALGYAGAGNITVTLPAVAPIGSEIILETINGIDGDTGHALIVTAAAGDTITQDNQTSSAGGTLTLTSHGAARHSVYLVCIVANTQWRVLTASRVGNFA